MARRPDEELITPEIVLRAYAAGIFPMADGADDPGLYWVEPKTRGVIPLDGLIVSRSLAKTVRQDRFEVSVDRDFEAIIEGCAEASAGRASTWINARIRSLYGALFEQGHVHTVECRRDGALVGGLYGVSLGGAFFGESMFHRATDASKVALAHLTARLRRGGYGLLDAQFVTDHLASLGAIEISGKQYKARLTRALDLTPSGAIWDRSFTMSGADALAALAS